MTQTQTQAQHQPLEGFRVIDMSVVQTGPFATHFLADHGAEVIKVEPPAGDLTRRVGSSPAPAMASIFQHINRGKRCIVLDLKVAKDLQSLKDLLATADAFIFNARPQAMRRLGLSYEEVKALNPAIVYCGISGFGERGPYAGKPAYDDLIQGATGVADLAARSGDGTPRYAPMAMADRVVGMYAGMALLMALLGRQRTGEGCSIEIPMFESMAHFVLVEHMHHKSFEPAIGETGNPRSLDRNRKPFPTLDGYVCAMPYTDRHWKDMFELLAPHLLQDARFSDFKQRTANVADLYTWLAAEIAKRSTAQWLELFTQMDIPVSRMNTVDDLLDDPHLNAVGFFERTHDDAGNVFRAMVSPMVWNGQTGHAARAGALGEHNPDVL